MAQHDYVIANGTGAAVRSDLNNGLAAIVSNNSGATEPATMYAYQWWPDTTTGLLKQRNAANSAWVTIGTLASANLGLLSLAGGTMTGVLAVTAGTAALPGIAVSGDLNTGLVSPGADQLAITTGGTSRLAVSTTAVSSTLPVDVPLGAVGTPSLTFTGDLNTGLFSPGADTVALVTSGSERARIDSSGRLLVGTSSGRTVGNTAGSIQIEGVTDTALTITDNSNGSAGDSTWLTLARTRGTAVGGTTAVSSGDWLGNLDFAGHNGSTFNVAARISGQVDGTVSGGGAGDMPGRLVFSTTADGASSPTERMRIDNTGQHRMFSTNFTYSLVIGNGSTAGTSYLFLEGRYSATDNSGATGTRSFVVWSNGNVQNTNNSYTGISDIKLKENIVDASSQWDDIKALLVRNYNLKEGQTHRQIGLIAQEVEPISPGLVYESPDRDEEGNDLGTVTKSVNYSVLYMKAVKALQEAMERIETLEARLTAAGIA